MKFLYESNFLFFQKRFLKRVLFREKKYPFFFVFFLRGSENYMEFKVCFENHFAKIQILRGKKKEKGNFGKS